MVILLLGILAAVGGPRFFNLQSYSVRGWTDQVMSTARYARNVAVAASGRYVRLVLNTNSISATLATDCTTLTTTALRNPAGNGNLVLTAPTGVTLAVTSQSLPYTVCFDSLGRPRAASSATGVLLTGNTTLQITGGASSTTIYLEPETGFIHP